MIVKVTSGSTPEAAKAVDKLYSDIIPAGTHAAASIEVAEAAKVIENTQRDLNIALMNELAIIFQRLAIDTHEVLAAASTKWNFLPFKPGLVGGHCIGVDPYYLTQRAREVGYHPQVILAGRRINDEIGSYVAAQVAHMMMRRRIPVVGSHVLILGLAFKENCPDLRNTKVIDLIAGLRDMSACVDICDPWVSPEEALEAYGMEVVASPVEGIAYDAMILAVSHSEFIEMGAARIRKFGKPGAVFYDVKGVFLKSESDGRL
jgi:UDP-N-acetyl-D-galactosamine dehydrogenase